MELKFKHLAFQEQASLAVVDLFKGQPKKPYRYRIDQGKGKQGKNIQGELLNQYGLGNGKVALSSSEIEANLKRVQQQNALPLQEFDLTLNFSVDMETGTGKTYTYIKTMFELNKAYGWSKFIVVVPSVAIREGVFKTFQMTRTHFQEVYGKQCQFFIYSSKKLDDIASFARGSSMQVMIINAQAFNAKGADARRIDMELDEFQSRKPIDVLARTRPILIIDEPQSVEGKQTQESLKKFNALFTLRYSATHKKEKLHHLVYRLDAMDAYNQQLVKKIAVQGISEVGNSALGGYAFLEKINLFPHKDPTVTLQIDRKGKTTVRKVMRTLKQGDDLYALSNELEEYKNGFIVTEINAKEDYLRFQNGITLKTGDIIGNTNEKEKRRLQIRETLICHFEREKALFHQGIKVLSLFFIDEVAKYKTYENSKDQKGEYAQMFEALYTELVAETLKDPHLNPDYRKYLEKITASDTHNGYFSVDKKTGRVVDSKNKKEGSDDVDAYDLIMKNKERLLSFNEPTRFIFSHSALKEGWDNPNVFQICTLKESGGSEIRRRQEVGRGLRLCVNQEGERMDANRLGKDVQHINRLTVIASESYQDFVKGLQKEIGDSLAYRPRSVTKDLFCGKTLKNAQGEERGIDESLAKQIYHSLIRHNYINDDDKLTDSYHQHKGSDTLDFGETLNPYAESISQILEQVYQDIDIENANDPNTQTLKLDEEKFSSKAFQALWEKIKDKTVYQVHFDSQELIKNVVRTLNKELVVSTVRFHWEKGEMQAIASKESLIQGGNFIRESQGDYAISQPLTQEKFDLVGKLVDATALTRKTLVAILKGINKETFAKFRANPEEFILKTAQIINAQKGSTVIASLSYQLTGESFEQSLFTEAQIKGDCRKNLFPAKKHLYDYVRYDSETEKKFAKDLDDYVNVALYVKLPTSFFIDTPVGKYSPDWAISFVEGSVKYVYFIAETKGTPYLQELRPIEKNKIECARRHFQALSNNEIQCDAVSDFQDLMKKLQVLTA